MKRLALVFAMLVMITITACEFWEPQDARFVSPVETPAQEVSAPKLIQKCDWLGCQFVIE